MPLDQIACDCALALRRRIDAQDMADRRHYVRGVDVAQPLYGPFIPLLQPRPGEQEGSIGGGEAVVGRYEAAMMRAID